eukprot:TRINITY_DN4856_c0_g1_i1.p1 TRINITY_DN4856_c0_g1~~TRINITY_DN4856_c0_g1_i1.p1  ORF type:complete len:224 (+),score=35.61 TRINITY_DN4856_c0_g1_i1:377-1048(+)
MVVREYVNIDLTSYLSNKPNTQLEILIEICKGVASGMTHLSALGITHNDLSARSILVQEILSSSPAPTQPNFQHAQVIPKIVDLSLSCRKISKKTHRHFSPFDIKYTAPEILFNTDMVRNEKTDVWSFGLLIFEIFSLCQVQPYNNLTPPEIFKFVQNGSRLPQPDKCPLWIYNLMLSCMDLDPQQRPTFIEIYRRISDQQSSETNTVVLESEVIGTTGLIEV